MKTKYKQNRINRENKLQPSMKSHWMKPYKSQYGYDFTDRPVRIAEAKHITRTILEPLVEKGGYCYFSTYTFGLKGGVRWKEPRLIREITSYMLNLSRETQSTITPFVGWWCQSEDPKHETHWHAAIHGNKELPIHLLSKLWKKHGISKHELFHFDKDGLSYIWGKHQYGKMFFTKPFTPPKNRVGVNRKPRLHKRRSKT